jgi:opacity protein-like surface antigen
MIRQALSGLVLLAAFQSVSASAADTEASPNLQPPAADIDAPPNPQPPAADIDAPPNPQPPAFAWTGCYVGGHFGGSGGKKEVSDSSGGQTAVGLSSVSTNTGGFLPGGQIGCDYQGPGNWVFGVQGALSAYTLKGETEFLNGSDFTVKANWLASATGRIGYAWNPWLLYAIGGVAWVRDNYEITGDSSNFTGGDTRTGWAVGVGLEYVFWGNWSADLEYRHYDFGTKNLLFTNSFSATVANTKQWIDGVTLGLNYHIPSGSWQPAAVSAEEEGSQKETIAINGGITYTTPYSLYGNFAMMAGPGGLDNSGFRIRLATVDGAYSFLQNTTFGPRIFGASEEGVGMVGYEFVQGSTSLLLMTGVNYLTSTSSNPQNAAANTANPVPGTAFGSKSLIELYSTPTDKTMVEAEGSYSTAFGEYYEEFKIGYAALGPEIYIGPEAIFLGGQTYDQYRLGGFVSGIKIGKVELGFSGGYLKDRAQGSGYFVGTDFYARF